MYQLNYNSKCTYHHRHQTHTKSATTSSHNRLKPRRRTYIVRTIAREGPDLVGQRGHPLERMWEIGRIVSQCQRLRTLSSPPIAICSVRHDTGTICCRQESHTGVGRTSGHCGRNGCSISRRVRTRVCSRSGIRILPTHTARGVSPICPSQLATNQASPPITHHHASKQSKPSQPASKEASKQESKQENVLRP